MFDLTTPLDQLPLPVQRLSDEARELWLTAYAETYEQTADTLKAELRAWGAVKREDLLQQLGMKSVDGRIVVAGWAMLFTDADNTDLSDARTYFDGNTETALDYYANAPLFYEHDGAYGIIGKRTLSEVYPSGIWLEHELDPNSPYFDKIASELERGVLFYSTDSIEHFVQSGYNPKDSHLGLWYLAGCSLTKTPAEPGLGPVTTFTGVVDAIKSAQGKRKASADEAPTPFNPPIESKKDTLMDPKQLALMLGLAETATAEDVVAKIQTLLDTASKMTDLTEEEMNGSKEIADLQLVRDALTMDGNVPTDEQLRSILQSALDSLGVDPELEVEVEAPVATASMKAAAQSVMEALKNSPAPVKRMPNVTNPNSARNTGYKARGNGNGFGTYIKGKKAQTILAEGIVSMVKNDVRALKAMGYQEGAVGGWLANRETAAELLGLFYANVAVIQAGARVYPMQGIETLDVPRMVTGTTARWTADGQTNTDSEPTFGMVTLQLREAIAETLIPKRLIANSAVNIEQMVMQDIEKSVRLLVDASALRGSGGKPSGSTGREIRGVLNTPNVNSTALATNGKVPTPADFTSAWYRMHQDNVPPSDTWGVIINPRTEQTIKNTTDTTGQTIPMERFTQGHKVSTTTQIPINLTVGSTSDNTEVYFGDWQHLYMGIGQDIEFVVDTSRYVRERQILVQAVMYVDAAVAYPQAFEVLTGVRG